jgi:hypothetical protein
MQAEILGEVRSKVMAELLSQPNDVAKLPLEERLIKVFKQRLN